MSFGSTIKSKIPPRNSTSFKVMVTIIVIILIILLIYFLIKKYRFSKANPVFFRQGRDSRDAAKIPSDKIIEPKDGYNYTWSFWFNLDNWNYKHKEWKHIFTRGKYSSVTDGVKPPERQTEGFTSELDIRMDGKRCISKGKFTSLNKLQKVSNQQRQEFAKLQCQGAYECVNINRDGFGKCRKPSEFEEDMKDGKYERDPNTNAPKLCKVRARYPSLFACSDGYECKGYSHTDKKYGKCTLIEGLNSPKDPIGKDDVVGPAVYIDPYINDLVIFMTTNSGTKKFVVKDIPINKWCNVYIVLFGKQVDVYMDGKLSDTFVLDGAPLQNYMDVYVTQDGGFSGKIGSLAYSNYSISPHMINHKFEKGPRQTSIMQKILLKLGLIKQPFRPMEPDRKIPKSIFEKGADFMDMITLQDDEEEDGEGDDNCDKDTDRPRSNVEGKECKTDATKTNNKNFWCGKNAMCKPNTPGDTAGKCKKISASTYKTMQDNKELIDLLNSSGGPYKFCKQHGNKNRRNKQFCSQASAKTPTELKQELEEIGVYYNLSENCPTTTAPPQ